MLNLLPENTQQILWKIMAKTGYAINFSKNNEYFSIGLIGKNKIKRFEVKNNQQITDDLSTYLNKC